MRARIAILLCALAAAAGAKAALPATPAIPDAAREARWAAEVVPQVVVGDAVWIDVPAKARVLALYATPAERAKAAVIIVHGAGVHPDWGLIGELRAQLADRGFATLSVQMPVLAADAPREAYRDLYDDAAARLAAAFAWLRAKGYDTIAIVSHSLGAAMADAFVARGGAPAAWVAVGMFGDFTRAPRMPVLDVVAERDFPDVLAAAAQRARRPRDDRCSRSLTIAATDHFMNGATTQLSDAAAGFIGRAVAGDCAPMGAAR